MEDDRGRFDMPDADLPEWAQDANGLLHSRMDDGKDKEKPAARATWYDYVFCKRKPSKDFRRHIDAAMTKHREHLCKSWATFEARLKSDEGAKFAYSVGRLSNLKRLCVGDALA